ncbi:hypothetical protein ACEQ8H_002015 [Pleosporales sp. CAS-2024a]
MPPQSQHHLIDVRTPAEFSTGPLISDIAPTINIEYQSIASLASIYAARGITVTKSDPITLYCRSGRRSKMALQTLQSEGYTNVRDIGGLEEARRVLDREQVERQLDAEIGGCKGGSGEDSEQKRVERFHVLVDGLKALEGR